MTKGATFHTRTGHFPIGFRRMGNPWHQDLGGLLAWMKREDFGVLDLTTQPETEITLLKNEGVALGTIDLHQWADYPKMLAKDKAVRDEAVAKSAARIRACAGKGARLFFTLMLTAEERCSDHDTFGFMVESYGALKSVLEETGARLSIEGWPAFKAHCCNPESYRAFFKEMNSPAYGINYDPSHLIRLGIDHVRFIREFAAKVVPVHGKDTELMPEKLYEVGCETNLARLSGAPWRYTIPGHGVARWPLIFQVLKEAGYKGAVCIEHEDDVFTGSESVEQEGLVAGARFLASC